jgi:diguanylate cyclase (GGDEF)-like protein
MVHGIVLFWLMTTGLQIALELHLVSLIPVRLRVLERKPWLVALYYGIGLAAGLGLCVLAIEQWLNSDRAVSPALAFAEDAVLVGWALSIAAILVWQVVRATGSRGRNQALLVLLGLLPWTLHILASTFWGGWQELDSRWTEHAQNFALLLFPATIFIAIFRYGLFDVENLVRRSLVYGAVATLVLLFLYILLTAALPVISDATGDEVALWLVTAMALVIGILFRPIRDGLERLVEKGLFPERRALRQRLIEIAGSLSDQDDMKELVQRLADDTRQALRLDWASVVAVDGPERKLHAAFSEGIRTARHEELVALLNTTSPAFANLSRHKRPVILRRLVKSQPEATRKLRSLGAEVLIPLYFQRRMIGILCLSSKQNGELFLREELELLDLFSHQIATNFENLRLFQDATYEGLTGLLRREAVLHQLDLECRQALERSGPISVFMIDLDHFKLVNDTYGHLFGDIILKKVAAAMKENVRAADALGRYGGEEFLLVLPDTDYPGALKAAEKLRKAIADLRFDALDGEISVQVTISIGAACSSDSATEAKILARQLLEIADLAVYKAKNEGRNRIVVKSTTGMVIETEPGQATSG